MKYVMYGISAIILVYWFVAFFFLHAASTVHAMLFFVVAMFIIGNRYGHDHHFLE